MDKLLLDTSYLLPIFGIGLEYRDFEQAFSEMLKKYEVKYNPVSLIETKWIILRHIKRSRDQRDALLQAYRMGVASIEKDERLQSTILTNDAIEEISDVLLIQHHLIDYFDRQIYSTAVHLESIFLTEDEVLHELYKKHGNPLKPKRLMKWKELLA